MNEKDLLKEYIDSSELRVFSEKIKVRLSTELRKKYDNGSYNNYLSNMQKYFKIIDTLDIKYPDNEHPILYVYIVPDDNYSKLLKIPKIFDRGTGGGKPVKCYDQDGFNVAYGTSQNLVENRLKEGTSISRIENEIHELAHIVHHQFFSKNQMINEGFAEAIPLYALNYEEIFDEHRNMILELDENQIFSAKELLDSSNEGTFGAESVLPNRSCSFRFSYISSYLFVRGCLEIIAKNNNCSKKEAVQKFLEIVKQSNNYDEKLIYDIAKAIGMIGDELLNSKELQLEVLKNISKEYQRSKISKK